jgi:hypothetical protein
VSLRSASNFAHVLEDAQEQLLTTTINTINEPPDYFIRPDKKSTASRPPFFKNPSNHQHNCMFGSWHHVCLLSHVVGLVVFWVGNGRRWKFVGTCFQMPSKLRLGKNYDARARWVCPQKVSRINKGGGDQLRLDWRGVCAT